MANKFESGITSNINKNENPFGYATDAEVNAMSPAAGGEMGSEILPTPKLDVNALLDNTKLIEEKFAGVPTEEVRSKLEYANLEATARMMIANPDQFGDIEAGEVFKELNKRRHIADDRTLKAFEVLDKMSGKRNNIESLREYLSFADELAAADTLDEQQKILRKRFASPALKAWDEAKANGNEVKLAREMLDKNGRAYGDIANSAIGMANPNAWLDYATQGKGENIAKPEWLSDERAVKEYEKKLLADELRANADAMMPYLTQEQRNLVNLAAAGADMNKFRGLFSLMKKKDRDLMMSMCQAVRPTFDGNFLSEMAVRAGLGIRDAFRAAGRADKAATATVMEYIGCKTKDDVESLRKSMLDDIDWAQSMSDLKLSDPEGFVDKALQGYADSASIQYSAVLGQALVYMGKDVKNPMASGALTYGGRALQGYTALSMIGEQFDNMLLNGVPLERAVPLAVAFGSVDAYIENMNIGDWLGRDLSPAQMKRIGIRAAFRSALKKDGKEFLKVLGTNALQAFKVTASEVREEILQGMNKELGLTIAEGKNILNAAESSSMFQEGITSLVEALPTCTAFGFMASANPTGSIAAGADSVYNNHLNIIKDAVAERNGLDKLNENYAAMAEKVARNEAQRIITATAGMSRKERNDWINAQTDLTPAEKMFYAEHCDMYEASVAQDGKTWADAHLTGSINEAMWAKAGWKFSHNERGEIDSVTTKTGETFKVKFLNRSATKADFDEKGLADMVEEYNRLVDENEITGEKLTGIDDPNIDKVTSLINGDFKGGAIVLYGARASNATLAHESTHGLNDALAKIGTKDAKRKLLALENAYGEKLKGGRLSLSADEHIAENVEHGTSNIELINKVAPKERVELKALAKNIVTGAKKLIGRGKGVGFVPVVRTAEGATFDPTDFLAKTIDDALVILARKEELEAAKKREISEANKRAAAEREAKRQKKIEMRKAEAEKRVEEAQVEAERVKAEAEAALKAKREELAKAAAEVHERNRIEAEFKAMWDERVKIAEDRARAAEAVAKYEEWKKDEAHKEEVLAAQEAQMNEILAEIAAEEKAEIDAINAKYEAEFATLAEEEAKDEAERAAEEERQRKLTAKMDENRKKAVKTMPRLGHAKNQDGETAQRARAAYEGIWKAKTGKVLTQADIDALAEVYGLPPEALNLKKSGKGYKLANEQLLSDDALTKFTDGLLKFYADLKSVKIIVPDVVVATEADAANSVPNEVYDPVTDTFVAGRIVIDKSAKSFREQAGMSEPTVSVDELAKAKENHPTRFSMDGGMGNGYDGYSMSVNARHAYARGEKPMSKWTKKDIIEGIKEINPEKAKLAEKMSLNALRVFALGETAWHHTSSMYNITSFYNVKEDFVENLTEDKVKEYNEVGLDKDDSKVYRGDFNYIEWVGVGRRKKAEKHHLENVIIEERGKFYYVTDANGNKVKKMIGSNGTESINYEDVRRREEEAKIRREKILKFTTEAARKFFGMSDDDIAEKKFYGNGFDVSMDGNVYKDGRKPSRYDYAMGIENFFKQGEQRAVKNENGGYSVETWDGSKWDREDTPTMFSMKPSVFKFFEERKELSNRFEGIEYEKYSRLLPNYQDGVANKENFFTNTFGVFTKVDRPNRDPDYVSHDKFAGDVSSEYWYTEDGVIRGSGHWGANVATCSWYLKDQGEEKPRENQLGKWVGVVNGEKEYGKIKWSDLLYKTDIEGYGDNARLTSFNNPKTILPKKGRYIKDWDTRFSLADERTTRGKALLDEVAKRNGKKTLAELSEDNSNAIEKVQEPKGVQKSANTKYPTAIDEIEKLDEVRFSFADEAKALILKKRPDMEGANYVATNIGDYINQPKEIQEKWESFGTDPWHDEEFLKWGAGIIADRVVGEIIKFPDSKSRKAALHWFIKGAIRLPEDTPKVTQALSYAVRAKGKANTDPLAYKSPMAMMDALHEFKPKEKPLDPDAIAELSDKVDMGHGVTTYLVQDDREGQRAMRRIINTHWGEDANPWCLLHGDGKGNLSDGRDGGYDAWFYWNHYNALPKRVAFKHGKLLAFMATNENKGRTIDDVKERYDEVIAEYESSLREDYGFYSDEYQTIKKVEEIKERINDYALREDFEEAFEFIDEQLKEKVRTTNDEDLEGIVGEVLEQLDKVISNQEDSWSEWVHSNVILKNDDGVYSIINPENDNIHLWNDDHGNEVYSFDSKSGKEQWWDREDKSHDGIPLDDKREILQDGSVVGDETAPDIRFSIGSSEFEKAKDIAKVSNPGESSTKFSIGDRSAANVGKFILAREIMENRGKLPDTRRAAQVAAAVGYYGNVQQLIAGAEAEAKQQTTLLQYLSSDKKISKLLADAGLAARNERALARGRSAALQFSREVSEAAEGTRKATERAVRHMRGEDYETMKLREGLDMNAILLAIRPAEPEADEVKGDTNTDTSVQPVTLNDAERAAVADAAAKAIARGAELVKKAKDDLAKKAEEPEAKKPEAKKSTKDDVESLAGDDDEAYGNAIGAAMAKAISEAGFTLDSPEAMVALVKAITEKYIKDFPSEFGDVDPNDVFSSPLVRAKFAANIASFATAVANAYAPSFTRLRVERNAQMLNDKGLTSMRKIEEVGESIFRDLNKDIIRQSRKEIIGSIKKILKPHAKHFTENELKQDRKGVDSALGRYCKIAYKVIEMSAAAVEERAKELEDELSTWSGVTEDEANRYREFALKKMELEMLDMFGNLRDRMPAELEELRDFVEQTVNESRWETMQFGEKWEASRSAAADAMEGAIIGDPDKKGVMPEDDEVGGLYSLIGMMETKAKQLTRFCKDSSIRETSLKAFGVVEEMIQNAEDIQFNYAQKMREKFTKLIVSVYGSESEAAAALDADIDESLWDSLDRGSFKTQWTIGRVLQMYVSCVQTDYHDNTAKWGRDGSYITLLERIINDHNPHHMEFIEGMRNLYMEMGDDLSEVMERTTGTRLLTPNRNYMPVKMMRENNIAQKARARAYSPFAPSLTPRVKNGLDFDQTADIIEVWKDRIEDTAHTIGWADVGSMIQGVCLSDRVLNAIRKAHGDKVMRQWNNYLLDILAGAERGREGDDIGAKVLRSIARLASRTWLMFNPASWAKQLAAIPCFALSGDGNLRDVTKSLSFCAMHPSKAAEVMRDLANTKAFQARYGVAISQEMKYATSGNRFNTFLDKIVNAGMAGTMKFDAFGVYALAGVYHNKRCELESQGKSAEASELASSWLMHIVDKTAQTTRSLNTTELQRAGGAWGLMLQFKSAPAQQTQFELGAWQDWAANKSDNARLKKALVCTLINHIIVPTINTAIEGLLSCLTSWGLPEDEKRERLIQMWIANIVSGSLGSIVFLGTVIEGLTDLVGKAATGGNVSLRGAFGESLPASGVVNLYLSAGDKAARALMEITDGDIQDGAYDMVKAILSVVPGASWISRKGFQAYESATER